MTEDTNRVDALQTHLSIIRSVVKKRQPIAFTDLLQEVEERAQEKGFETSRFYIARLVLASTANLEASRIVFPNVKPILLVGADGRYGLNHS